MKFTHLRKILSLITVFALIAAMVLSFTGCSDKKSDAGSSEARDVTITVDVVDDNGDTKTYDITTTGVTLCDALLQEELIEGEDGPYGFYILSVNGLLADYNVNGAYWGLFKDGEYLMTGISETPIADGEHYEIVYTTE